MGTGAHARNPETASMNTATYRGMALKAEKELDWAVAAQWWGKAISKYPSKGALASADIARMQARLESCLAMAAPAGGGSRIKVVCPFPDRPIYDAIVDGERIGSWRTAIDAEKAAEAWVRRHPC
jgi:hypothetical protein